MTTLDLPAWNVDDDHHGILGSNNLSTPDTATELVLDSSAQPLAVGIYSVDGTGTGLISLPDLTGVVSATYVVIAYAEASEAGDPTDWSPDAPDPTQFPFLMIESSSTAFDGGTLDPIPVGGYSGETVYALNDLGNIASSLPKNRLWLQSYSEIPIHVAYLAVRLTYAGSEITADVGPTRTRFYS